MFEAESINAWRDHDVVDREGGKIGSLESIYVDTATDEPFFAGVKVGMIGRHRPFVSPKNVDPLPRDLFATRAGRQPLVERPRRRSA